MQVPDRRIGLTRLLHWARQSRQPRILYIVGAPLSRIVRHKGHMSHVNSKERVILDRIRHLEDAITKGREFLERGKHADWHGFRALFLDKVRDGKVLPPHKDWIQNVFLPRHEEALRTAQKSLERLASVGKRQANQSASGKAGIASRAEIERHRPGVPEPGR